MKRPCKPVIALIGPIGSGKSRVAYEFARHGGAVIRGDHLGHEALREPAIRARIAQRWGDGIHDATGQIDRRKLGRIVFADTQELRQLEQYVFPFIEQRIEEEIAHAQNRPDVRFIVLDAAVLLEAGWNRFCDWIVYIHAPRELRLKRLASQRGWTQQEVQARADQQLSLTDKVTRADAAIDNSGSPEDLTQQVVRLLTDVFPVAS